MGSRSYWGAEDILQVEVVVTDISDRATLEETV